MTYKKYKSLRLKEYDYSQPGAYFVTICVKERKCSFGEVSGDEMLLNEAGKIAQNEIDDIENHYENVEIGEYVVMPNHVHLIIYKYDLSSGRQLPSLRLQQSGAMTPTKSNRLQDVVGSYKSGVSREIRKINKYKDFKWQRYFHDHIVRTVKALENISDYTRMNPAKWAEDIENELYISGITEKMRTNKARKFYNKLTI